MNAAEPPTKTVGTQSIFRESRTRICFAWLAVSVIFLTDKHDATTCIFLQIEYIRLLVELQAFGAHPKRFVIKGDSAHQALKAQTTHPTADTNKSSLPFVHTLPTVVV